MIVFLDTGVLGSLTHRNNTREVLSVRSWLAGLLDKGHEIVIPEIADYELRRKLMHIGSIKSIKKLDDMNSALYYSAITTDVMRKASEYWAQARSSGNPTSDDKALDGDVILCAQVEIYDKRGENYYVATTNVGHLSLFVHAEEWQRIT